MPLLPAWVGFEVTATGFEEVDTFLSKLRPRHMSQVKAAMREWGEELVFIAGVISPKDKLRGIDWRRRPKDESFAKQWRWQIETEPKYLELQVGNIDERREWIIDGTPPRDIVAQDWAHPMYFYWEDGYEGPGWYTDWVIVGGVADKGTKPHPVHIQTLDNFNVHSNIARLASRIR